jgi:hypothetical protein
VSRTLCKMRLAADSFVYNRLVSGLPTSREFALLWFAFQRLANREQENGTLAFRMRREEVNHVIVEERQPGRTQALGIRSQIHPASNGPRLQLDSPVAAAIVGGGVIPSASISAIPRPSQIGSAKCSFIVESPFPAPRSQDLPNEVRQQDQQHQTANATNPEHKVEGQSRRIDFFLVHRQSFIFAAERAVFWWRCRRFRWCGKGMDRC